MVSKNVFKYYKRNGGYGELGRLCGMVLVWPWNQWKVSFRTYKEGCLCDYGSLLGMQSAVLTQGLEVYTLDTFSFSPSLMWNVLLFFIQTRTYSLINYVQARKKEVLINDTYRTIEKTRTIQRMRRAPDRRLWRRLQGPRWCCGRDADNARRSPWPDDTHPQLWWWRGQESWPR